VDERERICPDEFVLLDAEEVHGCRVQVPVDPVLVEDCDVVLCEIEERGRLRHPRHS